MVYNSKERLNAEYRRHLKLLSGHYTKAKISDYIQTAFIKFTFILTKDSDRIRGMEFDNVTFDEMLFSDPQWQEVVGNLMF